MNIIIKETGEKKTLEIENPETGLDCTEDFIGNGGGFTYGDFTPIESDGYYLCSQETYGWWKSVMAIHEYANRLMTRFRIDINDLEAINEIEELMQNRMSGNLDYFFTKKELEEWFEKTIKQYDIEMVRFNDDSYYFKEA
jgi:hypothetical protein